MHLATERASKHIYVDTQTLWGELIYNTSDKRRHNGKRDFGKKTKTKQNFLI